MHQSIRGSRADERGGRDVGGGVGGPNKKTLAQPTGYVSYAATHSASADGGFWGELCGGGEGSGGIRPQ